MVFIAQTALYMAAKIEQHIDTQMGWYDFEAASRKVPSFAKLMEFYGAEVDDFCWEFEMNSLEQHICYLCSYKLNHVTPSQVAEELYQFGSQTSFLKELVYYNDECHLEAAIQVS